MGEHYVPQKYLAAFSAPDDSAMIWMYDKVAKKWTKAAIANVAQQRGYYGPETERQLNELVEVPGNRVLEKLRAFERIKTDEREILANYLAVTLGRVPKRRSLAHRILPGAAEAVLKEFSELVERHASECGDAATAQRIRSNFAAAAESVRADPTRGPVQAVLKSPWVTPRILQCFRRMTWRILRVLKGQTFVTSDNPAFFLSQLGLGRQASEITVPISPKVAIHGFWRMGRMGQTIYSGIRPETVKEFNRRQIDGAERFIFSPSREDWIEKVAAKEQPRLSRINWTDIP